MGRALPQPPDSVGPLPLILPSYLIADKNTLRSDRHVSGWTVSSFLRRSASSGLETGASSISCASPAPPLVPFRSVAEQFRFS